MNDVEHILTQLLPIEVYRPPMIPTLQFGVHALVGIGVDLVDTETASCPRWCFVTDPDATRLLGFFDCDSVQPRLPVGEEVWLASIQAPSMSQAAGLVRRHGKAVRDAFLWGDAPSPVAREFVVALGVLIPPGLYGWLSSRCSDFFAWATA
jgi:hypothetical protein